MKVDNKNVLKKNLTYALYIYKHTHEIDLLNTDT